VGIDLIEDIAAKMGFWIPAFAGMTVMKWLVIKVGVLTDE
jgi:hypothetical protein